MILILLILAVLLFVVIALNGEGSMYGNNHKEETKSKLKFTDKNYFL